MRTCAIFAVPRCLIDLVYLLLPITPEDRARENIDKLLTEAGMDRQDKRATNLSGRAVAVRDFRLKSSRCTRATSRGARGASTSCKIPAHMEAVSKTAS